MERTILSAGAMLIFSVSFLVVELAFELERLGANFPAYQ